ncbi:MAG TPA: metal-binding (seleno)protein [Gemmatimonadaceae bacterium]
MNRPLTDFLNPMRTRLLLFPLSLLAISFASLSQARPVEASAAVDAPGQSHESPVPSATLDTVTLHVEGMTCGGCTLATRKVLERLAGVTKAKVSYEEKRATVVYDPAKVTVQQMIAAVATLKYTATVVTTSAKP